MRYMWLLLIVLFVMIYFISPYDLIPDFWGLFGRLDDLALAGWLILFVRRYLLRSRKAYYYQGTWGSTGANIRDGQGNSRHNYNNHNRKENRYQEQARQTEQKGKDPHVILNVSPNASKDAIKAAYKELIKKYHPDKVAHLGEEFQKIAHEKMIEIQWAYETLMAR